MKWNIVVGGLGLTTNSGRQSFLLPGGSKGVLLIHGFTGSPAEMRLLGEFLQVAGYTVLGIRLAGHGTTPDELGVTRWIDWYRSVENGYDILSGLCNKITVIGLSMGGLLALHFAAMHPVDRVVSLSAPIFIYDRRLPYLPVFKYCWKYIAKKRRQYDVQSEYSFSYDKMPLKSLDSMLDLLRQVCNDLPQISAPAYIIQSKKEHTVKPESAQYIYNNIGSDRKELLWLERSGHIVTIDCERETVFTSIVRFLEG